MTTDTREKQMVIIARDADDVPAIWCDPEIAPLVRALNDAGIRTVASCSGHGERPGNIALSDGRELLIARDYNEARLLERLFNSTTKGAAQWPIS